MNIIKDGNKVLTYECGAPCGCIFEMTIEEVSNKYNYGNLRVSCPNCNQLVRPKIIKEEKAGDSPREERKESFLDKIFKYRG